MSTVSYWQLEDQLTEAWQCAAESIDGLTGLLRALISTGPFAVGIVELDHDFTEKARRGEMLFVSDGTVAAIRLFEPVENEWVELFVDSNGNRSAGSDDTELVQIVIERDPPSWNDGASVIAAPHDCVMEPSLAIELVRNMLASDS